MRRVPYLDRNDRLAARYSNNPKNDKRAPADLRLPADLEKVGIKGTLFMAGALDPNNLHAANEAARTSRNSPMGGRRPVTGRNNYIDSFMVSETPRAREDVDSRSHSIVDKRATSRDKKSGNAFPHQLLYSTTPTNLRYQVRPRNGELFINPSTKQSSREKSPTRSKLYRGSSFREQPSFSRKQMTPSNRPQQPQHQSFVDTRIRGSSNPRQTPTNNSHVTTPRQASFDFKKKVMDFVDKSTKLKQSIDKKDEDKNNDFFEYVLRFSYRSKKGYMPNNPGKTNQDSYIITPNIGKKSWQHYFGVCDGHGVYGHLVSAFIKNHLPAIINTTRGLDKNPKEALQKCFKATVDKLVQESRIDLSFSGSTVVGCYLLHDKLYCCNVGDSRAIIGSKDGKKGHWGARPLSIDHKPCLQREADRIVKSQGRVEAFKDPQGNPIGPLRVWLKDENIPGLAMTRSFGDMVAASVGVSHQPEILEFKLTHNDKIIVIASDGVWEFLSNEEIINLLSPYYEKSQIEEACDALLEAAHTSWTRECSVIDDISFVLIFMSYNDAH